MTGTKGTGIIATAAYITMTSVIDGKGDALSVKNAQIYSSTITNNAVGVRINSGGTVIANRNNIYDNVGQNMIASTANVDARYNYWHRVSTSTVNEKLTDKSDNFTLGTVDFGGFVYGPYTSNPN